MVMKHNQGQDSVLNPSRIPQHGFAIDNLLKVLIIGLIIIFSQVLTLAAVAVATKELTDIELEDKSIKQELGPSETEEIEEEEDNTAKEQEEEGEKGQQESNGDTAGTELEEDDDDNIMTDDNYLSDDDVPFELPFDDIVPFP
jgi:hypothetical protein